MYDHLLQHLKAVGIEQQRLQSENATLKEFATQKADQYANLITQAERMKKALEEIATQRTCAEVEADEDIPIGSDGSRLGMLKWLTTCAYKPLVKPLVLKKMAT
jgi:uncharacterized protein (DUF3084 family)